MINVTEITPHSCAQLETHVTGRLVSLHGDKHAQHHETQHRQSASCKTTKTLAKKLYYLVFPVVGNGLVQLIFPVLRCPLNFLIVLLIHANDVVKPLKVFRF